MKFKNLTFKQLVYRYFDLYTPLNVRGRDRVSVCDMVSSLVISMFFIIFGGGALVALLGSPIVGGLILLFTGVNLFENDSIFLIGLWVDLIFVISMIVVSIIIYHEKRKFERKLKGEKTEPNAAVLFLKGIKDKTCYFIDLGKWSE